MNGTQSCLYINQTSVNGIVYMVIEKTFSIT